MDRASTHASFGDVVVVVHDVSGQPKVADLHDLALGEQDVPGGQVSVDTLRERGREKDPLSLTGPYFLSNIHCFPLPRAAWSLCKHACCDHWIFKDNN